MAIDYRAVRADLLRRKQIVDTALTAIDSFLADEAEITAEPEDEPEPRKLKRGRPIYGPKLDVSPKPDITIDDAIFKALQEDVLRTSTELADRVQELRPNTHRASVQSAIYALLSEKRIHKDDNLKMHLVVNGRIA